MKDREERRESHSQSTCEKKRATWEKLKQKKLNVNPQRLKELESMKERIFSSSSVKPLTNIMCINLKEDTQAALAAALNIHFHPHDPDSDELPDTEAKDSATATGTGTATEPLLGSSLPSLPEGSTLAVTFSTYAHQWYPLKHFFKVYSPTFQAVLYEVDENLPWELHETVLAMSTLLRLPLVILAAGWSEKAQEVADKTRGYTCGAWSVLRDPASFVEEVRTQLPKLVALCAAISKSIDERVAKYKKVNGWLHGVKRGAVAFVPFGVHVVNFIGIVRLVHRMLKHTGMMNDKEAKKTAQVEAAATGAKLVVIDSLGDVYQYAIFGTLLAGFAAQASASGFEVALAGLGAMDFALLGSISVVTGVVSAVGAYIQRPHMVEAIARFITTLQMVYLLSPEMRRTPEGHAVPMGESSDEEEEEENGFGGEREEGVPAGTGQATTGEEGYGAGGVAVGGDVKGRNGQGNVWGAGGSGLVRSGAVRPKDLTFEMTPGSRYGDQEPLVPYPDVPKH